jgi:hypothetical protein
VPETGVSQPPAGASLQPLNDSYSLSKLSKYPEITILPMKNIKNGSFLAWRLLTNVAKNDYA